MKRGITPLLAWVLLFAFAVAIGVFIIGWVNGWLPGVQIQAKPDLYCDDVQITFQEYCRDSSGDTSLFVNVSNKGYFTVTRFTIQRTNSPGTIGSCLDLLTLPGLEPGSEVTLEIPIKGNMTGQVDERLANPYMKDCDVVRTESSADTSINFTKLSLIPWIDKDEETFPCIDKKITLNNVNLLNTLC